MAWSDSVGSKSWTGGTRKYKSFSDAVNGSSEYKTTTASVSTPVKGGVSTSKSGGGGSSQRTVSPTPPPPLAPTISIDKKTNQEGTWDSSRYVPPSERKISMPGYGYQDIGNVRQYVDRTGRVVGAETYLGPKTVQPSSERKVSTLTTTDMAGRPTRKYIISQYQVNARTPEEARAIGASTPGLYNVLDPKGSFNYPRYGEPSKELFPRVVSTTTKITPYTRSGIPIVDIGRKDTIEKNITYESRSGLQGQAFMTADGQKWEGAYASGFQPVTLKTVGVSKVNSEEWNKVMSTKSFKYAIYPTETYLGSQNEIKGFEAREKGLAFSERPGATFEERARGKALSFVGKTQSNVGQFFTGTSRYIREEPGRAMATGGIALGVGLLTGFTGTAASIGVGGRSMQIANYGLRGALGAGAVLYGANEYKAISASPRPYERAAYTFMDTAIFYGGSRIGSSLVPTPSVNKLTYTGVTTKETPIGSLTTTKGYYGTRWLGRDYKVGFTNVVSESPSGVFGGVTKFSTGFERTDSGRSIFTPESNYASTVSAPYVRSQRTTLYDRGGISRTYFKSDGKIEGVIYRGQKDSGVFTGRIMNGKGNIYYYPTSQKGIEWGAIKSNLVPTRMLANRRGSIYGSDSTSKFGSGLGTGSATDAYGEYGGFSGTGGRTRIEVPTLSSGYSVPLISSFDIGISGTGGKIFGIGTGGNKEKINIIGVDSFGLGTGYSSNFNSVSIVPSSFIGGNEYVSTPISFPGSSSIASSSADTAADLDIGRPPGDFNSDIVPIEPIPIIPGPFGGPPPWGYGSGRKGGRGRAGTSFKTRYNPSLIANVLNIKGTRGEGKTAALTGIGVRPFVGGRRRVKVRGLKVGSVAV